MKPRRPSLSTTGNPHWVTPNNLLEVARIFAGGQIALDPFDNPESLVNAHVSWHGPRARDPKHRVNGLTERWIVDTSQLAAELPTAWVQPPYTRHVVDECVAKARTEGRWGPLEVCALLPGRESAGWFKLNCFPPSATALCFLDHRVKFIGAPTAVPWESVIVHWGRQPLRFYDTFGTIGTVWLA
jgi:hypothetical protein